MGEYTTPIQTPAGFLILSIVDKKEIEQDYNIDKELPLRINKFIKPTAKSILKYIF